MLSGGHLCPKLLHLPTEILFIFIIERRRLRWIELDRLHLLAVDPQGDGKRLRPKRAGTTEKCAHNVLTVNRKPMKKVKGVWKHQSSRIVIRERRDTWNDALKRRAKLHHCRFHLLWSKN